MTKRKRQTRARGDADKAARKKVILAAAAQIFAEQPYADVTMAQIARAAQLAKGTLYLYFPSKEELFLELTVGELLGWMLQLGGELAPGAGVEALSRRIAETFVERPRLARLLALLHSVLEQNITVEAASRFNRNLVALLVPSAQAIELIAELEPGEGNRFLLRLHAVMVGLAQMCDPSAAVSEARSRSPELEVLSVDLQHELQIIAEMLLRGATRLSTASR